MNPKTHKKAPKSESKSMKVSAKARYALRILKDVSDHQDTAQPTTEFAISERQGISTKYLSRIVLPLRDAGLLKVRQGSHAGFRLGKDLAKTTLLEVIETVQGRVAILDCLSPEIDCPRERGCFARKIWSKANAGFRATLAAITLAD